MNIINRTPPDLDGYKFELTISSYDFAMMPTEVRDALFKTIRQYACRPQSDFFGLLRKAAAFEERLWSS